MLCEWFLSFFLDFSKILKKQESENFGLKEAKIDNFFLSLGETPSDGRSLGLKLVLMVVSKCGSESYGWSGTKHGLDT